MILNNDLLSEMLGDFNKSLLWRQVEVDSELREGEVFHIGSLS